MQQSVLHSAKMVVTVLHLIYVYVQKLTMVHRVKHVSVTPSRVKSSSSHIIMCLQAFVQQTTV